MNTTQSNSKDPFVRIFILLFFTIIICLLAYHFTGSIFASNPKDTLVYQTALLLLVFGSTLIEYHFTKPADSLINAFMAILSLATVYRVSPPFSWWLVFLYCGSVFVFALVNISVSSSPGIQGWRNSISNFTYLPAVHLGQARLIFSILFLFGLISFYQQDSPQFLSLILFWGFYVAIWPLKVPEFLSGISMRVRKPDFIGRVLRNEWPNIVRFEIKPTALWKYDKPKFLKQADGTSSLVVPLYSQLQGEQLIGTGLIVMPLELKGLRVDENHLYEFESLGKQVEMISQETLLEVLGGGPGSKMIGFVVEGSTINEIKFESWEEGTCKEGILVWCKMAGKRIFYQVIDGSNKEESFQTHRQGYQLASAIQLGSQERSAEFERYPWLPIMNTPVFVQVDTAKAERAEINERDFLFGKLPGSDIEVTGPFLENLETHTAILGITGSGKTELAFELIRHSLKNGVKVVCIDLTTRYRDRLTDLKPVELGLSEDLLEQLKKKLFDVEVGQYKASDEKRALEDFLNERKGEINGALETFLFSEGTSSLAIIELAEIASTVAALHITELYLSSLFAFARTRKERFPRVLIVVEEAQTVMPEPSGMEWESKGLINRISQIALQGRKYKIGLLIISQRTATVSKSVLTQCNSIISFACIDDTSLGFLKNVFGEDYARVIPNLRPLTAVMAGKCLRSRRPLIVEIPFDAGKAGPD